MIAHYVSGSGDPLILLAGQLNSHHWWDSLRDTFAETFTAITVDYRGTGNTPDGDTPMTIEGFAADVLEMMDHLNVGDAHLFGTSMGGKVAQVLAASAPDRVRKLVLGCTSGGGARSIPTPPDVAWQLRKRDNSRALRDVMYTPEWIESGKPTDHMLGDPHATRWAARQHFSASHSHDSWHLLARITAPTLIVHGSDDPLTPVDNAWLLADAIDCSTVTIIDGGRHAFFDEFAETVVPVITDFLAS